MHSLIFYVASLQQLTKLTGEYDQLLSEFEGSRLREAELQKHVDELRQGSETVSTKSVQQMQLMEKELEMIREENNVLHAANEKLVQNSLTTEQLTRSNDLQQQTVRSDVSEKQLSEALAKCSELEKSYRELMRTKIELEEKLKHLERLRADKQEMQMEEDKEALLNGRIPIRVRLLVAFCIS
ncbi:unnamed protein product [Gongylonema pulchrum]|uniref:HOOK domain-containing protein n=1 Tax=Gongylonema pulchrum TaxID=637853 RepID=A0A183ET87_9BILA|nr:unnamed protein product [Gongylonema pulchrum]